MTDKEKNAIIDCDTIFMCLEDCMSEDSANDYRKSYKILKNLIENQQKEIEELKEKNEKLERKIKRVLIYLDWIDDDMMKCCSIIDVNGIDIVKILNEE